MIQLAAKVNEAILLRPGLGASPFFSILALLVIWSADILVRPRAQVNPEADKNVRAPKK